jgi:hypothetical protein
MARKAAVKVVAGKVLLAEVEAREGWAFGLGIGAARDDDGRV